MPEYKVSYHEVRYFERTVFATDIASAIDVVMTDRDSTSVEFIDRDNTPTVEADHIYRVEDSE